MTTDNVNPLTRASQPSTFLDNIVADRRRGAQEMNQNLEMINTKTRGTAAPVMSSQTPKVLGSLAALAGAGLITAGVVFKPLEVTLTIGFIAGGVTITLPWALVAGAICLAVAAILFIAIKSKASSQPVQVTTPQTTANSAVQARWREENDKL